LVISSTRRTETPARYSQSKLPRPNSRADGNAR
jgi:hypothetical protein